MKRNADQVFDKMSVWLERENWEGQEDAIDTSKSKLDEYTTGGEVLVQVLNLYGGIP